MTSWIDGSFVYSTSEAWIAVMRSFQNGTLRADNTGHLPPKNTERVPLSNAPSPHVLRMLSPERMFCKLVNLSTVSILAKYVFIKSS